MQAARRDPQQLVAGLVAEAVVHPLEAVEIEEHHRERPAEPLRAPDRLLEMLDEARPVGQPGERVVISLMADPLLVCHPLYLLLAQDTVGPARHPEHERVEQRQRADDGGDDLPLRALHSRDERGDIRVDLHHRLHRGVVPYAHRDIGGDEVAVGDDALPGVEPVAEGDVARGGAGRGAQEAGVRALVLADLAHVGREDGQPRGVVDLDLDDVETRGEQPEIALEPQDLIAPRQLPARQLRGIADERGVGGPDRVGERFGERDVRARLGIDESVERKTAVEPRQG